MVSSFLQMCRKGDPRVIHNFLWLVYDFVFRGCFSFFVWAMVTRYLQPDLFGIYSYAVSLVALFAFMGPMGMDQVAIRELVREPEQRGSLLGTILLIRLAGGALVVGLCSCVALVFFSGNPLLKVMVMLLSLSSLLQAGAVVDLVFQSEIRSRYSVWANHVAIGVASLARIIAVLQKAGVEVFVYIALVESALAVAMLVVFYTRQTLPQQWAFSGSLARRLLKDSWPLLLSGAAVSLYMRIDQVMIGWLLGNKDVGIYAAALRVSEFYYFVPLAVMSSVFPVIVRLKKEGHRVLYDLRLQQLFALMMLTGGCVAVLGTFFSAGIIGLLYGPAYNASAGIFSVHIWTGIFVAFGLVRNGWAINENLVVYLFVSVMSGAALNIGLNFIFIPWWGAIGSAWATLATQILVSYCFTAFISKKIFFYQTSALFCPWTFAGLFRGEVPGGRIHP